MYDFTQKYNQKDNDCLFLQYSEKILYGSYYKT